MTKEKQNAEAMPSRYETLQSLVIYANVLRKRMHGNTMEILQKIRPSQEEGKKNSRELVLYVQKSQEDNEVPVFFQQRRVSYTSLWHN